MTTAKPSCPREAYFWPAADEPFMLQECHLDASCVRQRRRSGESSEQWKNGELDAPPALSLRLDGAASALEALARPTRRIGNGQEDA